VRDPGTVYVIVPEEVVRDDRPNGVDDGDGAIEREPLVTLEV
jgi:hypothetical protein